MLVARRAEGMAGNDRTDAYPRRRAFALGLARVGGSALLSTVFSNIITHRIENDCNRLYYKFCHYHNLNAFPNLESKLLPINFYN
jgi:hypothetical protein